MLKELQIKGQSERAAPETYVAVERIRRPPWVRPASAHLFTRASGADWSVSM